MCARPGEDGQYRHSDKWQGPDDSIDTPGEIPVWLVICLFIRSSIVPGKPAREDEYR